MLMLCLSAMKCSHNASVCQCVLQQQQQLVAHVWGVVLLGQGLQASSADVDESS
jgi:hypothetical protein